MNKLKSFYNNSKFLNAIRYRITPYMIRKKKAGLLFDDSGFYRLNLNCQGDAYYGYVNIEDTRTKARVFVSAMHCLPFKDNEVKTIIADFATISDRNKDTLYRIFRDWGRVMVPNGILTMDNIRLDDDIKAVLMKNDFEFMFSGSKGLLPVAHFVYSPKLDYKKIDTDVIFNAINKQDKVKIKSTLEYMSPMGAFELLRKIFSMLGNSQALEIVVKNESLSDNAIFFDKASLCFFLTEIGFLVEAIEIKGDSIRAVVKRRTVNILEPVTQDRKLCAVEQFLMFRYNRLGFDDDAMPRACETLGIDGLFIEGMRNLDYGAMKEAILAFKPGYFLFRLKELLPFVEYIKDDLRKIGSKVIFWFCDPDHPQKKDLSGLVDVMFLSNRGQIPEYREAYNVKKIYYMPQGFDRGAIHRIRLPELYDVGFSGALSAESLHDTRRELIEAMRSKYSVKVNNNVRNNIAEFYGRSRTVFGVSDFDYELYTSNRFFIALGCGACYIAKRFKGIELLAENKKHILYFDTKEEMFDLLDYYLSHDAERENIRSAAEKLALEKHTYAHRIKNILDITDGKTEKFYGFL
ncbi:MAG: glycosyltransferase [Candidatus Omnitrophica bacterium]|nr:glycosyltransferase [Candidatus Omnitrophota bacterium]